MAVLEIQDLRYAVGSSRLLESISFSALAGHLVAIIGPNGAGKTTLLRAIAGLLAAEGIVRIDGDSTTAMPRKTRARRMAFVAADDTSVDALTVHDVVAEGRYAHRRNMLDASLEHERVIGDALERTALSEFRYRRFGDLSSGERRRAWIALGLAQEADVLLLDEPTANLDINHAQQTLKTLRGLADAGRTVITVLHDLNEAAQFADEIALVDRSRLIAFGPPPEVLTPDRVARCYGVHVDVVTTKNGTIRIFT
jgi:iron complex transport system ATP-binding protein